MNYSILKEQKNDMDDEGIFDKARISESSSEECRKRAKLIRRHVAQEKAVENCRWCIGSNTILNECIVLSKSKVSNIIQNFGICFVYSY